MRECPCADRCDLRAYLDRSDTVSVVIPRNIRFATIVRHSSGSADGELAVAVQRPYGIVTTSSIIQCLRTRRDNRTSEQIGHRHHRHIACNYQQCKHRRCGTFDRFSFHKSPPTFFYTQKAPEPNLYGKAQVLIFTIQV